MPLYETKYNILFTKFWRKGFVIIFGISYSSLSGKPRVTALWSPTVQHPLDKSVRWGLALLPEHGWPERVLNPRPSVLDPTLYRLNTCRSPHVIYVYSNMRVCSRLGANKLTLFFMMICFVLLNWIGGRFRNENRFCTWTTKYKMIETKFCLFLVLTKTVFSVSADAANNIRWSLYYDHNALCRYLLLQTKREDL